MIKDPTAETSDTGIAVNVAVLDRRRIGVRDASSRCKASPAADGARRHVVVHLAVIDQECDAARKRGSRVPITAHDPAAGNRSVVVHFTVYDTQLSTEVEDPSAPIGRGGVINHLTVIDRDRAGVAEDATAANWTRRAGDVGQGVAVHLTIVVEHKRALIVKDSPAPGSTVTTGDLQAVEGQVPVWSAHLKNSKSGRDAHERSAVAINGDRRRHHR